MRVKPPMANDRPKPESRTAPAPKKQFAKLLDQKEPPPMPMQYTPIERRVEDVPAPAAAAPAQNLTALASEIGAKIESSPAGAVTITFDSMTFDGLQVQLTREQGHLTVKVVSPSPELANQLSAGAENLRQRLEERGYRKAIVQVQRAPRTVVPSKEKKPWQ